VKRTVRVLRRAQRDLQQIYDYVAREAPLRADSFIDGFLDAIESLDEFSDRGATPRDSVLRRRGYRYPKHRKYLVLYKVLQRQARVYRIVHAKRAYRHLL
jgi:plasmid stabilization system protein ParE